MGDEESEMSVIHLAYSKSPKGNDKKADLNAMNILKSPLEIGIYHGSNLLMAIHLGEINIHLG